jgi:HSP20 family molecular chaperone IbpA
MKKDDEDIGNLGSIFKGLDKFINIVNDMVENEKDEVNINGSLGNSDKNNKAVGRYGLNIRLGSNNLSNFDKDTIGSIGRRKGIKTLTPKFTEPPSTDIFDEGNCVIIVMELPGVLINNIEYELQENIISVRASAGTNNYYKNINLRFKPSEEDITAKLNNSIYTISIRKEQNKEV